MPYSIFMSSAASKIDEVYPPRLKYRLGALSSFFAPLNVFTPEALTERENELKDVNFIFSTWGMPRFERSFIAKKLPNLKALFYGAGSVQGFAREFLEEGRTVVSAWAANAVPVAEFTVAQIILAAKGYFNTFKHISADNWPNRRSGGYFRGNYDTKIGIIGAGMVGREVIKLLKNYRLDVYVFDPFFPDGAAAELGVKKAPLDYIFKNCQIVSNHLANNAQTKGMLDGKLFSLMAPNSAFINTGRGAQVVEADLIEALVGCPDRVAFLDVTDPEPPPPGSELYRLPNVFLSPHIAGSAGAEVERMGEYICEEFESFINGRPLKYAVTLKMLETMA